MARFIALGLPAVGLVSLALAGCPGDTSPTDSGTPERDTPSADVPGLDAPGLDAPGLDAPGLDAPGLDAPTLTDSPTTSDTPSGDAGSGECTVTGYPALGVMTFVNGLDNPIYFTQAPGSDDYFIVEQDGRILVADATGTVLDTPFLDIRPIVAFGGGNDERGLLGLAFHPDYVSNGLFYVYYIEDAGDQDQIVAVGRRASARVAEATVDVILREPDQAGNHNGGALQFGRDGELYVAIGDGGPQGDPENDAQTLDNLLGKILRIHVDATTGTSYTVPASNPFAGATAGADEIYFYGLRNPWRFSFDRLTGDIYIGDVGQGDWEEVSVADFGTSAGDNFGWNRCEGFEGYSRAGGASGSACTFDHHRPAVAMSHGADDVVRDGSISVVSGYVYRGGLIPGLWGAYLFGDFGAGYVAAFRWCEGAVTEYQELMDLRAVCGGLASFGQDNAGELYLVCRGPGTIRRIIAD